MKHYDYVEWVLYKKGLLNNKIYEEMENHLYLCDECMEIFLSLIDEEEIADAGNFISEDFTSNIISTIKNLSPIKKPKIKKANHKSINDFFLYYTAVASVAIVLTATGTFGRIVDIVPEINNSIKFNEIKLGTNKVYNFSENITNKTSEFINQFQFRK